METLCMKSYNIFLTLFMLTFNITEGYTQVDKERCKEIQNGIFYFYPQNSKDRLIEIREGDYLKERNLDTGDTTLWKIKWDSECIYRLTFISSSLALDKAIKKVTKKYDFVYKITSITDQYYTFTGYLDNIKSNPIQQDTIWMSEKISITNNTLYENVPKELYEKAASMSDTSKYALLHVYRPGKFSHSLSNFLVYFNDNIMCVSSNNRGYVFKVLKEGLFNIHSRLLKDSAGATINVRFGKKYYVKPYINWTITGKLYNFRLGVQEMDVPTGVKEFEEVKYK